MSHIAIKTLNLTNIISTTMAFISGMLFLVLAIYMTVDVTSRYLGGPFTGVADQFASFALALGGTWSLARALSDGSHVRIDVFMQFYGMAFKRFLYVWSMSMVVIFSAVLTWQAWIMVMKSIARGASVPQSMITVPLAVPQSLAAIGFTMLTIQAVVMLIAGVALWCAGEENLQRAIEGKRKNDAEQVI